MGKDHIPPADFFADFYYFDKQGLVDKRQRSGRFAPVFGPPTIKEEEKYIERWLRRDRETEYRQD
jgi:hypothetical protein